MHYIFSSTLTRLTTSAMLVSVLFVTLFIFNADAAPHHTKHSLMGSHGMALVAITDKDASEGVMLLASHMPLYYSPHNYQIIYAVDTAQQNYLLPYFDKGLVTALPKHFDLNKLINGEEFSIETDFYAGHFERGGKKIASGTMHFKQVILRHKLSANISDVANNSTSQFFIRQASANKAIAVHQITAKPSFDAISIIDTKNNSSENQVECSLNQPITLDTLTNDMSACGLGSLYYLETQDFQ